MVVSFVFSYLTGEYAITHRQHQDLVIPVYLVALDFG